MKPLVVDAKQHFRPLAGPISLPMCLTLRVSARWAPDTGAVESGLSPEIGSEGIDQEAAAGPVETVDSEVDSDLSEGGPPMMPPSRKLIAGACDAKRAAIERAVRGEIAFRSR